MDNVYAIGRVDTVGDVLEGTDKQVLTYQGMFADYQSAERVVTANLKQLQEDDQVYMSVHQDTQYWNEDYFIASEQSELNEGTTFYRLLRREGFNSIEIKRWAVVEDTPLTINNHEMI